MIRINLLGVERQRVHKTTPFLDPAQRALFGCSLVAGLVLLGICGWFWHLSREASRLEAEIATAQQEMARLQVVLAEVKRHEDRRAELVKRVEIIEQLREGQSVPVQLLDHVSRSVPEMLWLTTLDQKAEAVTIEGRTTTLVSLADFVANLGTNKLVSKPIDIVNSEVETATASDAGVDVIRFSVRAPLVGPAKEQEAAPAGRGGAAGAGAVAPKAAR